MLIDGVDLISGSEVREIVVDETKKLDTFPVSPTEGDKFFLKTTQGNYPPGIYTYIQGAWTQPAPVQALSPYDVVGFITGKPDPSAVMLQFIVVRKIKIGANFIGCRSTADTAATATTVFSIYQNNTSKGTLTYAANGTSGVFSNVAEYSYVPGDIFKIVAPATVDSTLTNIRITIAAALAA